MSTVKWLSLGVETSEGFTKDPDWEYRIDELKRVTEEALLSSDEVANMLGRYLRIYNDLKVLELRVEIYPSDLIKRADKAIPLGPDSPEYAVECALLKSKQGMAILKEFWEEEAITLATQWLAVMDVRAYFWAKQEREAKKIPKPAVAQLAEPLDQVDGKPLQKYSLNQVAFLEYLASHDVGKTDYRDWGSDDYAYGKTDEKWLRKLHLKPLQYTVSEADTVVIPPEERWDIEWLKSIGIAPLSQTFILQENFA